MDDNALDMLIYEVQKQFYVDVLDMLIRDAEKELDNVPY